MLRHAPVSKAGSDLIYILRRAGNGAALVDTIGNTDNVWMITFRILAELTAKAMDRRSRLDLALARQAKGVDLIPDNMEVEYGSDGHEGRTYEKPNQKHSFLGHSSFNVCR